MTAPLRGLALLDAAIAHIEAHPETWFQQDYRCGSGMCVAGWVCELAGGTWLTADPDHRDSWYLVAEEADPGEAVFMIDGPDGRRVPVIPAGSRAEHLIGAPRRFTDLMTGEEDESLFAGHNDLEDIKHIRDEIAAWFESQAIS